MVVRWGFNGIVRDKYLEGNRAGFSGLPFGVWFPLARFTTPEEVHSTDEAMERERMVTKTADSVEKYLGEVVGGKDAFGNQLQDVPNFGFASGFYGELDVAKMAVISATLLPSLPQIRSIAKELGMPSPISQVCEGQDSMDAGKPRQNCPTCWFKWLQSPVIDAYIAQAAATGRSVDEFDPTNGQSQTRIVAPTIEELNIAKEIVTTSIGIGLSAQQTLWNEIATDVEKKEIKGVRPYQHGIRKDLHEARPEDKELSRIREFANASNERQSAPVADNSLVMERVVSVLDRIDQRLTKLETPSINIAEGSQTPTITEPESNLAPAAQKMEAKKQERK